MLAGVDLEGFEPLTFPRVIGTCSPRGLVGHRVQKPEVSPSLSAPFDSLRDIVQPVFEVVLRLAAPVAGLNTFEVVHPIAVPPPGN